MTARPIWIFGDRRNAAHWEKSLIVAAKAKPIAEAAHVPMVLLLVGAPEDLKPLDPVLPIDGNHDTVDTACYSSAEAMESARKAGFQSILYVSHPKLQFPTPFVCARITADLVETYHPWLVLFALNDFGRETAAFGAQYCQAGMIADCADLTLQDGRIVGRCPAWGGQILADISLADGWTTAFATIQPHGVKVTEGCLEPCPIDVVHLDNSPQTTGLELIKRTIEPMESRRLEEADTVVVGGAGMGDIRGFGRIRELAAALGGEVGATRPPILSHWVDENRLIGQTGKTIHPKLLITVGTSGAVQYTAGITDAQTIVAINRDSKAPIFQWADIGIVADAADIIPLLAQRAKQSAMRRLADATCTMDDTETISRGGFGDLVRRLREARNWSVNALAQATAQTPDFIEQVENEVLSPPVSFIMRMAQAMQVDPGTFLRKEEKAAIRDMRTQAYQRRTRAYSYTTLTPEAENSHLRAFMITIEPHHVHKPVAYKHEGEEFIFVMEGVLEFRLGSKVHLLKPGESIHFNSDTQHKLKSKSNETTRCLVVLYTI